MIEKAETPKNGFTVLGMIAVVALSAVVDGFVISRLWAWFVVPLGVRPIGIAHACGLDALGRILASHRVASSLTLVQGVARCLWRAAAVLGIGYIAHVVMR